MSSQLCFDFYKPASSLSQRRLHEEFCRCAVKWFLENKSPDGYGVNIPTRITNIRADAAFFWSGRCRGESNRNSLSYPLRTAVVLCAVSLDQCWVNCGNYEQMMEQLKSKRRELDAFESVIRRNEPQLREGDALFEEYAVWNYAKSANRNYQKARQTYMQMEKSMYEGSRFERIASARVADNLYLAIPSGLVNSVRIFRKWGILEVHRDRRVTLVREPVMQETTLEARNHLVHNIAVSNSEAVSFSLGLRHSAKDDRILIMRRPRRSSCEEKGILE